MKKKLLIATHNPAKLADISRLISNLNYELVSLTDLGINLDVEETGTTFEENALLKASTYAKLSGLSTIADDSGLMIDALNGEPGIYSARYAGEHATDQEKVSYLLNKMKDVPEGKRRAVFVSAVAFANPGKEMKVFRGECVGQIAMQPKGNMQKGYPYKIVFQLPEYGNKTLAELVEFPHLSSAHRKQALTKLLFELA